MRRSNTQHLSSLIKDFISETNCNEKLREVDIIQKCHELLGKTIGRYVKKISMAEGTLFIQVTSSVVKSELIMHREELRRNLNDKAGGEIVLRIVLR